MPDTNQVIRLQLANLRDMTNAKNKMHNKIKCLFEVQIAQSRCRAKEDDMIIKYGLVTFTICALAVGQMLFKLAAQQLDEISINRLLSIQFLRVMIPALALYGVATAAWVLVLRKMPLSTAYGFMALSFVIVPTLSAWFFKEAINFNQIAGYSLIVLGVLLATR